MLPSNAFLALKESFILRNIFSLGSPAGALAVDEEARTFAVAYDPDPEFEEDKDKIVQTVEIRCLDTGKELAALQLRAANGLTSGDPFEQ